MLAFFIEHLSKKLQNKYSDKNFFINNFALSNKVSSKKFYQYQKVLSNLKQQNKLDKKKTLKNYG